MTIAAKKNPDKSSQNQDIPENMHVSILAKENEDGQKELKITLGGKEIELSSSGPRQTRTKVDGKEVEYSNEKSHREKKDGQVVFELFELQDRSVKLVSDKYNVKVVYDGSRAKIEVS